MDIHTSRYMCDAPCDIHGAFPTRNAYASYSDAFMTRSVSDVWETRLNSSVEKDANTDEDDAPAQAQVQDTDHMKPDS